jgi:hypothetical protein
MSGDADDAITPVTRPSTKAATRTSLLTSSYAPGNARVHGGSGDLYRGTVTDWTMPLTHGGPAGLVKISRHNQLSVAPSDEGNLGRWVYGSKGQRRLAQAAGRAAAQVSHTVRNQRHDSHTREARRAWIVTVATHPKTT